MSASSPRIPKRKSAFVIGHSGRGNGSEQRPNVLLREEEFVRQMRLERRRSERSGRPFLLMLLEGDGLLEPEGAGSVREELAFVVLAHSRDTDIAGWYRDNAVMAVLYTEIGSSAEEALAAIQDKVSHAIKSQLPQHAAHIRLSLHVYPSEDSTSSGSGDLTLYPELRQIRDPKKKMAQGTKRVLDIVGSTLILLALAPVFAAIALAIKLTSAGPVFFRQRRIGQYGRPFTFLKFRSMFVNNNPDIHKEYVTKFIAGAGGTRNTDAKGNGVFKITNDPRVTRIGRLLRRASLDELPQFLNVLTGDMSLVGPRPPVPYEVERYDFWHRRRLFEAKPGITGLWQVNGRSRLSFDDMVRLDLEYVRHSSFLLDLEILLRTPAAVLSGDGAY